MRRGRRVRGARPRAGRRCLAQNVLGHTAAHERVSRLFIPFGGPQVHESPRLYRCPESEPARSTLGGENLLFLFNSNNGRTEAALFSLPPAPPPRSLASLSRSADARVSLLLSLPLSPPFFYHALLPGFGSLSSCVSRRARIPPKNCISCPAISSSFARSSPPCCRRLAARNTLARFSRSRARCRGRGTRCPRSCASSRSPALTGYLAPRHRAIPIERKKRKTR